MKIRYLLYPFSLIYGLILAIRNKIFDLGLVRQIEFDVPVIGVGNLQVGGSGKTPHVAYLINLLKDNYQVAVLSRGYGRRTRGFLEVETSGLPLEVGDEPLMLKQMYPDIPVAVCENRPMGVAELLMHHPEIDIVLLDDVFQHRYIKPGYMILLSDYNRPFFRDMVMPAGNLREFRSGVKRADLVLYTKCPEFTDADKMANYKSRTGHGTIKTTFSRSVYSELRHVSGPEMDPSNVVLVTGIANATPLLNYIDEHYAIVRHLKYRDHHRYSSYDIKEMVRWLGQVAPSSLVTTAKDWVKLKPLLEELTETSVFVQDIIVEPYDLLLENEVKAFVKGFNRDNE